MSVRLPSRFRSPRALLAAGSLGLALVLGALPALARGPGNYAVAGKEGGSKATYDGSATLTQIGEDTWRIVWKIGGATWNGFGIGDGKVIAANFSGGGQQGVMLLIAKEGGGYEAVWAYNGETKAGGFEDWTKR